VKKKEKNSTIHNFEENSLYYNKNNSSHMKCNEREKKQNITGALSAFVEKKYIHSRKCNPLLTY